MMVQRLIPVGVGVPLLEKQLPFRNGAEMGGHWAWFHLSREPEPGTLHGKQMRGSGVIDVPAVLEALWQPLRAVWVM